MKVPYGRRRQIAPTISQDASEDHPSSSSFGEDFEKHSDSIYQLLLRMLGGPDKAEDVALGTFYRLSHLYPDPEPEFNIGGSLVRVATNLGLHSICSFKRREHYEITL